MSSAEHADRVDRAQLAAAVDQELRTLVSRSVLFHQAVADRLGLSVLDLNCLGALVARGPMAAGQLAEENGVTTGAITGVIDRLEAAGHVRRDRDPKDRRRVLVTPMPNLEAKVFPLFESLGSSLAELCERFTESELETVLDFVRSAAPITHDEAVKLRAGKSAAKGSKRAAAAK
ncbi:MarR family winged helix-turn-helix transcriptional regulator [Streptomyces sp. NPDC012637]|uniref:MarR family winged helix-turn-helix transcriptional regulator n=1 Tax=Streptomyces sp. NPDC012637 TaxID=3364842 RepID=UPI0036E59964